MDEGTLEEMKAQLGLLNGKLKEQEIVNENLIRQSIRNRISEINRSAVVAVRGVRFGCGFGNPEGPELQEKLQQMDYNRHGGRISMGSMDDLPVSVDRKR